MAQTQLYTAAQTRELDRIAIEQLGIPGITLIKRAGQACVDALLATWPDATKVAIYCGAGNNAGDGYIIAGLLANKGVEVDVAMVGREPQADTDAGAAYQFCRDSNAQVHGEFTATIMEGASVVVDALLGTGVSGEVRPEYAQAIKAINAGAAPVLAVDLPSGLCADTGGELGVAVRANLTVTFIGDKLGLHTNDGPEMTGKLVFAGLDVPGETYEMLGGQTVRCLHLETELARLERRHRNAHKTQHGHVLVMGGNAGMGGAALLAGRSCLHAGAGLVSVATHPGNVGGILASTPELMARGIESAGDLSALMQRATLLAVGPGLGRDDWARMLLAAAIESGLPAVFDADALNLLAEHPMRRDNWVLTPHPGEAASLLQGRAIQPDRLQAVTDLQREYGGVVLLKGAGTLIADDTGVALCPYGNPGMSVGGVGDVLSGVISGLAAQSIDLGDATRMGAVVHAYAADVMCARQGERGMLASELMPEIRGLLNPNPRVKSEISLDGT